MIRQLLCLASAMFALSLVGCGGGSGDSSGGGEITRELLTEIWRLVSIRGNANYEGGGVDVACPVTLKKLTNPALSIRCGSLDNIVFNPDGTATYRGASATWSLSGSTVTLDLGSTLGVRTASVTVEPGVAGLPNLRLRQLSRVVGGVRNTDEDGVEIVLVNISS